MQANSLPLRTRVVASCNCMMKTPFLKVYGIEQVFAEVESARSKYAIIMVVCNEVNVVSFKHKFQDVINELFFHSSESGFIRHESHLLSCCKKPPLLE